MYMFLCIPQKYDAEQSTPSGKKKVGNPCTLPISTIIKHVPNIWVIYLKK